MTHPSFGHKLLQLITTKTISRFSDPQPENLTEVQNEPNWYSLQVIRVCHYPFHTHGGGGEGGLINVTTWGVGGRAQNTQDSEKSITYRESICRIF